MIINAFVRANYGAVTTVAFLTYAPANFAGTGSLADSSQANARAQEAKRKAAHRRLLLQMNVVDDIEGRLSIHERWTAADPEYQRAHQYLKNREFIRAVEALEGLVVQRLFELAKANLSGTGMYLKI